MRFIFASIRAIFWSIFAILCGIAMVFSAIFLYLGPSLPSIDTLKTIKLQTPLRIYSSDSKLIDEFGEVRRTPVRYDQIPPQFVQALLSVEDRRFESHIGVDPKGFSRAMLQFIATGQKGGGGSTLTQQVAKNYFLSNEKLFTRKFREILLAIQMEQFLSKQEIFELYVNKTFLGHRAYGIQAAAQVYYGRDINDLVLPELAMLAGLPQRPSVANPLSYPTAAKKRRNQVLTDMYELGFITELSYQEAIAAPLTAGFFGNNSEASAPWIGEMVRDDMVQRYGTDAYNNGYRVYTTINSRLQESAATAVQVGLLDYDKRHGFRGPYRKLVLDAGEVATPDALQADAPIVLLDPDAVRARWIDDLSNDPGYAGLRTAAVWSVDEQRFTALLSDNTEVAIEWDNMRWARWYIDASNRGPEPQVAADIVSMGDVIWVTQGKAGWELSQLPTAQGALVSIDPNTGAVQSLVGGFEFNHNKYNRVIQAKRQPGSNIKPFLYAAALDEGMTAATIINDSPITLIDPVLETTWRPKNSGYIFDGPIRLREALYRSKNVVSIRILQQIGVGDAVRFMSRFGLNPDDLPKNLTLALGSASLTPMSIAEGYSALANGGYKVAPYFIQRIEDRDGNIIFEANPEVVCASCIERDSKLAAEASLLIQLDEESLGGALIEEVLPLDSVSAPTNRGPLIPETRYAKQVISPQIAYVMNSIMRDVVLLGTGRRALVLNRKDLAGKTGTTNDGNDAWFSGFNGNLVTTTWVGFDQPSSLGSSEWGGSAALPIWIDYMRDALAGKPEKVMEQPPGMITVRIDPKTGLLAKPDQKNAVFEIFAKEQAPTQFAPDNNLTLPPVEATEADLLRAIQGEAPLPTDTTETTTPELLF